MTALIRPLARMAANGDSQHGASRRNAMPDVFQGVDPSVMQRLRTMYMESVDDHSPEYGSNSVAMGFAASHTTTTTTTPEEEDCLVPEPELHDQRQSVLLNSVRFRQRRNASPNIMEQVDLQQFRRRFCNNFHHNDEECE